MYFKAYLVTIESTGIFTAEDIFLRALKVLEDKAKSYVIWFYNYILLIAIFFIELIKMKDFKKILSTEAFSYIRDTSKISFQYGKHMATYVSAFTMIMKTCKGRDKICSVIQYIADFYYNCNKYSEI